MKNKIPKKSKNNEIKKMLLFFGLGAIIFGIAGVSATTLLYSKDVTYDNSSSGLSSTNLQDALDELYEQAKNAPECDKYGTCTVICPSGTIGIPTSTGYGYVCSNSSFTIKKLGSTVVTSGDGLYADSVTSGRYIYRGSSVNNYITFNDETWRIISVESDGTLKIIRNEQLSSTYAWDESNSRDTSASTYCVYTYCDAWATTANLVGIPSTFIQYSPNGNSTSDSTTYSGTVVTDASLNTYLNGDYYSGLSSTAKSKVTKGTFNVSTPGNYNDTETLDVDAEQEKQYQWKGSVALITMTELLRASTNSDCTSLSTGYNSGRSSTCSSNNWLWPTFNTSSMEWTLSSLPDSVNMLVAYKGGYIGAAPANGTPVGMPGTRPVLHLSSSITLSGSGTQSDPYTIN